MRLDDPAMDYETLTGTRSQERIDKENLDTLTLCCYIFGGFTALCASFFIAHIFMGLTLAHNPNAFAPPGPASPSAPPTNFPPEMGYAFAIMGAVVVLGGWTLGALTIYAGRCLKKRTNYVFIQVVAGLISLFIMPLGTALGVFTFIVLARPSVKALFP